MFKNILLTLASTFIFLVMLEIALRAIGPGDETAHVLDDELVYKPGPSTRLRFVRFPEHGGDIIETRFDAHGFRAGTGDPLDRDAFRVFIYGDSFIQASYSRVENTFAGQLKKQLSRDSKRPVSVINAGVDGYGPDQILLRLKRELPVYQPDLVVLSLFADNDIGDLIRNKLFRLGANGDLQRHAFVIDDELLEHYQQRERFNNLPAIARSVIDPQVLRRDLRILFERRLGLDGDWFSDTIIDTTYRTDPDIDWIGVWLKRGREEFEDYVTNSDSKLRLDNVRSDHYDADVTIEPQGKSAKYKLSLADALLEEIAKQLHASNTPLIVMIIPSPIDACIGYDWRVDSAQYPNYDRHILSGSLAQSAQRLKIPYLDLFEPFATDECNDLYFHHGNNHWNDRGQSLAARLAAQKIHSLGLTGSEKALY